MIRNILILILHPGQDSLYTKKKKKEFWEGNPSSFPLRTGQVPFNSQRETPLVLLMEPIEPKATGI